MRSDHLLALALTVREPAIGDASSSCEHVRVPRFEETAQWERWVDELERHALDHFEYEAMLMCRDGVVEELELAGIQALFDRVDELDARFQAVTVDDHESPFAARGVGWWWRRLPANEDSRRYTLE